MTELEQLKAMLSHAAAHPEPGLSKYCVIELQVTVISNVLSITTGPDDATATFVFDNSGTLLTVAVSEA